jgi:DNA methyltransferase 1-associated protein 1
MGEAEQILGVQGQRAKGGKGKKGHSKKKPPGLSNEAWQLQQDSTVAAQQHPPVVPSGQVLERKTQQPEFRPKQVSWIWRHFRNSARSDGLQLKHWARTAPEGGSGKVSTPTETDDGDYAFTKFSKPVDMVHYSDSEYSKCVELKASANPSWTKAETDRLFDLLHTFNMNFIVVHDRWDFGTSRSVEELKERYYDVAKCVVRGRSEAARREAPPHALAKEPFNRAHEESRKDALERMFERSTATERQEQEVLAKAQEIETRRKSEVKYAMSMGGKLCSGKGLNIDIASVSPSEVQTHEQPIHPCLPWRHQAELSPGVYLRKRAFIQHSNESLSQGSKGRERLDKALDEVGMRPYPQHGSHRVCDIWSRMRQELAHLFELRRQVSKRYNDYHYPQSMQLSGGALQQQHQQQLLVQPQAMGHAPPEQQQIGLQQQGGPSLATQPGASAALQPPQQPFPPQNKKQSDLKRKASQNEDLYIGGGGGGGSHKRKKKH